MRVHKLVFFAFLFIGVITSIFKQGVIPYEIGLILISLFILSIFIPQWAIYLLIIIAPINLYLFSKGGTWLFYSKEYLYLIVSFLFFIRIASSNEKNYLKNPLTTPIILFILFMMVQAIRNPNIKVGFEGFRFYLQHIPFMYFSLVFFRNKERLHDLVMLSFMALIIVAFLEIFKFQGQIEALWRTDLATRIGHLTASFTGGALISAMLCVTINCLALGLVLKQKGPNRVLLLILILSSIVAIFFSHTRGAYISLIFSILIVLYYSGGRPKNFVVPVLIVIVLLAYIPTFSQRFFSTYDVNANLRIRYYAMGLKEIMDRQLWLFGTGLFTHDVVGINNWQAGMPEPIFFDNYFLIILAETGIIGVMFLAVIFFRFLQEAKKIYSRLNNPFLKSLALGIITMWVTLFFALTIGAATWVNVPIGIFFWLFAGVIFNLPYIENELAEKQESSS